MTPGNEPAILIQPAERGRARERARERERGGGDRGERSEVRVTPPGGRP